MRRDFAASLDEGADMTITVSSTSGHPSFGSAEDLYKPYPAGGVNNNSGCWVASWCVDLITID